MGEWMNKRTYSIPSNFLDQGNHVDVDSISYPTLKWLIQ